ncbi:MAG: SPOR domain-containing protein [Marinilabiliaceae bacterium]|nr:SPOR domain-containing protein [Marinilabiliaceae bacterium]
MKKHLKIITLLTLTTFILSSCASLSNQGSSSFDDSDSPYVEEDNKPAVKKKPKTTAAPVVVKEEKVKVVDEPEAEVFKYYVIIGSFKVLDNAQTYKTQLRSEGFMPVILENENGLYRVSVSAYNTEMPARDKIGGIREKFEKYNDVWLLIRKQ